MNAPRIPEYSLIPDFNFSTNGAGGARFVAGRRDIDLTVDVNRSKSSLFRIHLLNNINRGKGGLISTYISSKDGKVLESV